MGPYERQKREQRRAREREARRSELVGLGTPVSQTRIAPAINRSPYEGVRIGNSQQGSYQYGKDMREKGFVERMDINGNYRWVDPKTGMQPDGSPLNPARTQPDTRTVMEPTNAQQVQTEPQEPVASLPEPFTTETQPSQEPTPVVAAMPTEESVAQNQPPPNTQQGLTEDEKEDQAAAKGGQGEDRFAMSRNFLATDKVPDSIFGYPIASRKEDYTPEDIEFFRAHPEAGGYYDLGEGSPEDGTEEGAPVQDDEPKPEMVFMDRNPTLFSHVKRYEKLEISPYEDIGGYAIGYGAHRDAGGAAVTAATPALQDETAAAALLARDLYARREALKTALPNWDYIPGNGKQALLDIAMGRDDVLSADKSKGLRRDLKAAGRDPEKLLAAVKKHYYSYRKSERPEDQAGLEARRVAGGKAFFGEEFSYKGKKWDPEQGFVKEGGE